jgi:hypothetical protein
MRLLAVLHDPWMALCFVHALGSELHGVVTYGGPEWAPRFAALGAPAVVLPPPTEATSLGLLEPGPGADRVAEEPCRLLSFKPSRRLEERAEELGASLALAPAVLAQRLENKLALRELATQAGIVSAPGPDDPVGLPPQRQVRVTGATGLPDLRAAVGAAGEEAVVVQSPRGFMGRKTWAVADVAAWETVREELAGKPAKVTRFVAGRPGTLNAVVDCAGTVLCTSPIVQLTGIPELTPYPLGSCGNDFTWRPSPHPGDGPYELARRLGPVLAARGYRGHFGLDFVVEDRGERPARTWLIEINPRLTASMALYSAWRPILVRAHLLAIDGGELRATGELPPLRGGQMILHNLGDAPCPPLSAAEAGVPDGDGDLPDATRLWSQVTTEVTPGATRGRLVRRGAVVGDDGALLD